MIELKKIKIQSQRDTEIAKAQADAAVRMNDDTVHANLQLAEKRLELEYQFRLAQLSHQQSQFSGEFSNPAPISPSADPFSPDWNSWPSSTSNESTSLLDELNSDNLDMNYNF